MALRNAIVAAGSLVSSAAAITADGMISAPRRGTPSVNPSGEIGIFSYNHYNLSTHKTSSAWHLLDIASGNITEAPFDTDVSEFVWLGPTNTSILYINGTNEEIPGGVTLYTADIAEEPFSPTLVASLDAPYAGLKAVKTASGGINFVVNCLAYWNNGSAYNPELATPALSTGGLYDNIFVRHWNFYIQQERFAVFSGSIAGGNGSYSFNGEMTNLLSKLEFSKTKPETPVQPFGDQGDYDISPDGSTVAFLTKSPDLPKANYTASYIYLIPHDGSEAPVPINGPNTTAPETAQGASGYAKWSPDGSKIAYAQQDGISYESDRFKLYIAEIDGLEATVKPIAQNWDSVAGALSWKSEDLLWVTAEKHAMNALWEVPCDADDEFQPTPFTGLDTYLADFAILPSGEALVSSAATWTSRMFYTQAPGENKTVLFTANEVDEELAGLKPTDSRDFWFTNEDGNEIQTFVYTPTGFNESEKYPLLFMIHGGPQVAQGDNWSTRWNLRLWADQGFVVVGTQFTGTPSYGQNFTDGITNNWGGTPYRDLVQAFEYIKENITYIDTDNAIAAGASYGCYMVNWIQSNDFADEFKALVCHDGKVSQATAYQTEELWFIQHDQNGTTWDNPENYDIWDPLPRANNWTTPEFIVGNDLDYRVVNGDALMLFNILQTKGVPSRFLHFPDEGHWVVNRENSRVWHRAIFNWIRYWTGQEEELIQDIVIKM